MTTPQHTLSRRRFLQTASLAAGGWLASRVVPAQAAERPKVALAQARSYDRRLVRRAVQDMLDNLGGLSDVIRPGDRVAIKTNLTGGVHWEQQLSLPATESYVTHPEVIRALGEAVLDAGARELVIVEAVYDRESFFRWGHMAAASHLGAMLINLNDPWPYKGFVQRPVGDGWLVYENFLFHPILLEVDAFISVAKMKCHQNAGITLSMKNLFGLVPLQYYMLKQGDGHRSEMHGPDNHYKTRVPRVVVDLVRARPIDFALIDGIKTSEGGEGPWGVLWNPVQPGVLVAGKNPVATDAVATAAMGFEPTALSFREEPFRYSINHLFLASWSGLGTHRLDEIDVVGASLDAVRYPFQPYVMPEDQAHARQHPGPYNFA
jgi:uncharacterized protein (DUF362 family)